MPRGHTDARWTSADGLRGAVGAAHPHSPCACLGISAPDSRAFATFPPPIGQREPRGLSLAPQG